jgi:hypothetical protein
MGIETAYCACTTDKTKTRVQMSGKFAHTMRLHDVKNADPEKRALNEVLIGDDTIKGVFDISVDEAKKKNRAHEYKTYEDYADETKWMVEAATGKKVRKDAVLEVEVVLTYSSSAIDRIPIDEWKAANVQWLKDYFGEDNVVSAVLHMDETTPHIHAMVTPIDRDSGQPKFNAKKWLGGRALMSQMQTSYGEAMKQFGLQRGEQNSRASHQDLQTFYRALNNVVRQKLPERNQFLDDQAYQNAIDEIYKESVVRMFALEQAIKRLEDVDKTRESNNSIYRKITEDRIKDYEDQIKTLQSDLSEAEKKAKFIDNMQTAIKDIAHSDPKRADQIRDNLNKLSRKGGELEKAFARKSAQDSEQAQGSDPLPGSQS